MDIPGCQVAVEEERVGVGWGGFGERGWGQGFSGGGHWEVGGGVFGIIVWGVD